MFHLSGFHCKPYPSDKICKGFGLELLLAQQVRQVQSLEYLVSSQTLHRTPQNQYFIETLACSHQTEMLSCLVWVWSTLGFFSGSFWHSYRLQRAAWLRVLLASL